MSIKYIQTLSMNPHYFGLLIQSFLRGYQSPCEINLVFSVLPVIMNSKSREKLARANRNSKLETLFGSTYQLENGSKISGRSRFASYKERYELLESSTKKALIILYSQKKIVINDKNIICLDDIDYRQFDGRVKEWAKAAFYFGIIIAKTDKDHLNYFLGVDS